MGDCFPPGEDDQFLIKLVLHSGPVRRYIPGIRTQDENACITGTVGRGNGDVIIYMDLKSPAFKKFDQTSKSNERIAISIGFVALPRRLTLVREGDSED